MKTKPDNGMTIKTPETMTDADICHAVGRLAGGQWGHWVTREGWRGNVFWECRCFHPQGWTTREGQVLESVPDYVNSFDAVVGVIRAQSFEIQREVFRHARLYMSPREACLVLLRATGYFNP